MLFGLQKDEFLDNPTNPEATMAFTGGLAEVAAAEVISEQDLYQTAVLLESAGQAQPRNSSQAKAIIKVRERENQLTTGWAKMFFEFLIHKLFCH